MDAWREIERIDYIGANQFWSNYGKAKTPVVVENSVPSWKPESEWTIEYLQRTVGHRLASVDLGPYEQKEKNDISIHRILDAIQSGASLDGHSHPYVRNVDIHNDLPELVPDITPRLIFSRPNWMACALVNRFVPDGLVEFFIGGPGSAFPYLHYDTHGSHAFITQLRGTKHVVALPPSETEDLVRIFGSPESFQLGCDPSRYENLNIFKTTLKAGDTLFVPNGWWHTTYMTELSISVSTNCVNETNWTEFVESVTDYNVGIKLYIKKLIYSVIGLLLLTGDRLGANILYRKYE